MPVSRRAAHGRAVLPGLFLFPFPFVNDALGSLRVARRRMPAKRILIVDDEELVRLVMRSVLQAAGYQVVEAADGEEALRLLTEPNQSFGVVLLDQQMPRLSGPETLRRIREQAPATKVVMLSGGIPDGELEAWIGQGDVRFLPKPFANAELVQVVQEALAG